MKKKFNLENINVEFFEKEEQLTELAIDTSLQQQVRKYIEIDYPIRLFSDEDESGPYWIAEHPDLPGCKTHGETAEEAVRNLQEAKQSWMVAYADAGKEIPMPSQESDTEDFSGKILVRMPKDLHKKLSLKAKSEGISLNQEIIYLLSTSLVESTVEKNLKVMEVTVSSLYTTWQNAMDTSDSDSQQ